MIPKLLYNSGMYFTAGWVLLGLIRWELDRYGFGHAGLKALLRATWIPCAVAITTSSVLEIWMGPLGQWHLALRWTVEVLAFFSWWRLRVRDDDDRWRRRFRKVQDAVQRTGSRLAVVPSKTG